MCTWKQVPSTIANIRNEYKSPLQKDGAQYFSHPSILFQAAHGPTVPSSDKVGESRIHPLLQVTTSFLQLIQNFHIKKETNISNTLPFILQ